MKLARPFVLFSFVLLASASQGGGKDESTEIEAYRLARLGYLLESAKNELPVEPPDEKESIEFEDDDNEFDCPTKPGSDMDYIQDIVQERVNDDIVLDMDCERVVSTVTCSFKYTNNGKDDYYLFKRDTPLEGVINSPYIDVYSNGEPLEYKGMIMLRDAPTRKDFVLLKAGKSISASISLTDAFEFTRNTIYTIQYNKPVEYIPRDKMRMSEGVSALRATTVFKSDMILILDAKSLSRPEAVDDEQDEETQEDEDVEGQSCETAKIFGGRPMQRNETLELHGDLCNNLNMSYEEVSNEERYKMWFGKYEKKYYSHVMRVLKNSRRGLQSKVKYIINSKECKRNMVAFIRKTGAITLCSKFFKIKNINCIEENKHTREGLLVRLLTKAFGPTYDITFKANMCQRLAKWLPIVAIKNSGNYEYFHCDSQEP